MLLSYYKRPLFLALAVYAGAIAAFPAFFAPPPEPLPFALPRAGALVRGRVADYPSLARGRWRFALDEVTLYGQPAPSGLIVDARDRGGASYGDTIEFLGDLHAPYGTESPGGLDWGGFLAKRGIAAEVRTREVELLRPANPLILLARGFRYRALTAFERHLPPGPASVLAGVVIGEKRSVPPDIRAAFQDSGAMHLLVASGSNVGFVAVIVFFFCSRLGLRRKSSGLAALALSGFYVLASGLDAPLVRAYLMFGAGLLAFMFRREAGAFHSLTAAALAILLWSPRALFDAGFQMSFLAAYGLTAGLGVWRAGVDLAARGAAGRCAGLCSLPRKALEKPAAALAGLLAVSFFAQLFLFPLLAAYFHRVSAVSLLANIALVPASGVAMALGFLMTALAGAGDLFAWFSRACGLYMELFIGAVKFFAGLPGASFSVPQPPPLSVAGFYLLALALLHAPLLGWRARRLHVFAAAGLALTAAGPYYAHAARQVSGSVQLFGDSDTCSALVALPGGRLYLVNPGLPGRKLAEAVLASGSLWLDGVLLTSAQEKNYSGLAELAAQVKIGRVLLPFGPVEDKLQALLAGLERQGAAVVRLWPGETDGPAAALWPDGNAGYTGQPAVADWRLGPVLIADEGETATVDAHTLSHEPHRVAGLNFGDKILNSK